MNADVVEDEVKEMRDCNMFGVQIDESTEITAPKILMVYSRNFCATRIECVVKFRAAIALTNCDATSIIEKLLSYLRSSGREVPSKLAYFTSDGASVILGALMAWQHVDADKLEMTL